MKIDRFHYLLPFFFLVILILDTPGLYCQRNGFKFFKNYDTGQQPQNWGIQQDKRGIIFVANHGGLIEFDGVTQLRHFIPNGTARSIEVDPSGTVYVGGVNTFGYMAPNETGLLKYISLLEHLKDNQDKVSTVWQITATNEGIYFRTKEFLFRWEPHTRTMKTWKSSNSFNATFECNGVLYIQQEGSGLHQMVKDSIEPIPGSKTFVNTRIYTLTPFDNHRVLIGTRQNGLFIYDPVGMTFTPFPTQVDEYIKTRKLYHGIRLIFSPGEFALATLGGGMVIIDSRGRLKTIFDKDYGLATDSIYHVFEDDRGNIWLGHDKGLSKIEYHSPISLFDENRSNLPGIVLSVVRHGSDNDLFVGTTRGLHILESGNPKQGACQFSTVSRGADVFLSLLSVGDSLLAAAHTGVFQVTRDTADDGYRIQSVIPNPSFVLLRSKQTPQRVWAGTQQGLISLILKKGKWQKEFQFDNIPHEIRTMVEEKTGELWLGTRGKGLFRLTLSPDETFRTGAVKQLEIFDSGHGLPSPQVHVFSTAGSVLVASGGKLFRFDKKNQTFLPDSEFGTQFSDGTRSIFRLKEDKNNNTWFHSEFQNFLAVPRPDQSVDLIETPFLRFPRTQVNQVYPDPIGGATWFASNDGLFRYDQTVKKNYQRPYTALIRRVEMGGRRVFDGLKQPGASPGFPVVPYKDHNLHFEFALPCFEAEAAVRYQSFLEGFDPGWSDWSERPQKDYTNLDAGFYTFRVRGKDIYGRISNEATFQFRITPAWYASWWAISVYVLFFLILLFFTGRWRSRKLVKEKQHLEEVVRQRTGEIHHKNELLEEQSEKLKEMDQVKSRFFTNISHEFRTPLTLIMGPLEQWLSGLPDSFTNETEPERKLLLMLRNSQRLLNLINQLLELSKLESGKLKLEAARQDIVRFLKGMVDSFEMVARKKELDLIFQAETGEIPLYFDAPKMEEVVFNLLSNAIKFTPAGGRVTVEVKRSPSFSGSSGPDGWVDILFRDNGPGVSREQLLRIFDRFYQAESSFEHQRKGTGIGLAIVKELVELHHGSIDAHSREDDQSGTEFVLHLPMGNAHLSPEEQVDSSIASDSTPAMPRPVPTGLMEISPPEPEADTRSQQKPDKQKRDEHKRDRPLILVVEDSKDMRDFIRGSLEADYTVEEAGDGRAGIQKAGQLMPDLIISDVMMPGADGFELCREIKTQIATSHIPVILLTAKVSEESIVQGLDIGADDYITKPFNTHILNSRIRNLIALRRQLQDKIQREMKLYPVKLPVSKIDEEFIKELKAVIEKNLDDEDFNVEGLCKKMNMSRPTIYRKIQALTGESPTEFLRSYRLKRGAELLKSNFGTVTEVALEVGFSSSAYFTKCFREKFNQLPSSFGTSES